MLKAGLLAESRKTVKCCQFSETPRTTTETIDIQTPQTLSVNLPVVNLAHILHSQKKYVSPVVVNCYLREVKYVSRVENLGSSGCQSKNPKNPQTRLHPPLSDPTKLGKFTNHHKLLCESSQKPLPVGGIASAVVELVQNQKLWDFLTDFSWFPNQTTGGDPYKT